MDLSEYLIALNMVDDLGSVVLRRLLDRFSSPDRVFKTSVPELRRVPGIGEKIARSIKDIQSSARFKNELKAIEKEGIKVTTILDEDYPLNLRSVYDPPIVLYSRGDLIPEDAVAIAIVGSRKASARGLEIAEDLSSGLAKSKITVVSGLARGIDSAAHKGAIGVGGRTIAVLGCGLHYIYPAENKHLYEKIADSGAVISEFSLSVPPRRENFPRRNRIISGLSLGVVVVEAAEKSGSLITANLAIEEGRDVFAVPHHPDSVNSKGTNSLIQNGAKLIEEASDIIDELRPELKNYIELAKKAQDNQELPEGQIYNLDKVERCIYDILSERPHRISELNKKSSIDRQAVSSSLLSLEIKGLVKKIYDDLYIKSDLGDKL
jgi:DNA processing protein